MAQKWLPLACSMHCWQSIYNSGITVGHYPIHKAGGIGLGHVDKNSNLSIEELILFSTNYIPHIYKVDALSYLRFNGKLSLNKLYMFHGTTVVKYIRSQRRKTYRWLVRGTDFHFPKGLQETHVSYVKKH